MLILQGTVKDIIAQLKVCHTDKSDKFVCKLWHEDELN